MHADEDTIISILVAWESGQKLTRVIDQFHPKLGTIKKGAARTFINKLIVKYGVNQAETTLLQRRTYWESHSLWNFANDLRKVLYKVIPYHTLIDYKVHSTRNYNADDEFFKHFNKKNMVSYNAQKSMAFKRGINWEFNSFEEWLSWWMQTGKFDQRGVTNDGYQMCRYNDDGPYKWNNVYCATGKQNKQDVLTKRLTLELIQDIKDNTACKLVAKKHNISLSYVYNLRKKVIFDK